MATALNGSTKAKAAKNGSDTATIDPSLLSYERVVERCCVLGWLREVGGELQRKEISPSDICSELADESSQDRDKRVLATIKQAIKLAETIRVALPQACAAMRDGNARLGIDTLNQLERITDLFTSLAPRNRDVVDLIALTSSTAAAIDNDTDPRETVSSSLAPRMQRVLERIVQEGLFEPSTPLTPEMQEIRTQFLSLREDLLGINLNQNPLLDWQPRKNGSGAWLEVPSGSALLYRTLQEGVSLKVVAGTKGNADINADDLSSMSEVGTPYANEELQDRMRITCDAARDNLQSRGTSGLFMAVGFVTWQSGDKKDRTAPLLLVPIDLRLNADKTGWVIHPYSQEFELNKTLAKRLFEKHDLELPEMREDVTIDKYLAEVSKALAARSFTLDTEKCALGLFISNTRKYDDLAGFRPWKNPASGVQGLLGKGFGGISTSESTLDAVLDTHIAVADFPEVMGCDGSQVRPLLAMARGENVCIEGPPGSGKSFFITEALIQAVLRGESVLFTAAKPAALAVVHDRLRALGLGDLVLRLDSHDVTRKEIVTELRTTAALGEPQQVDIAAVNARYESSRNKLNAVKEQLSRPIGPDKQAISVIADELIQISSSAFRPNLPGIENLSRPLVEQLVELLVTTTPALEKVGHPAKHPFAGSRLLNADPSSIADAEARLREGSQLASAASRDCATLLQRFGVSGVYSSQELRTIVEALTGVQRLEAAHGANALVGVCLDSPHFSDHIDSAKSCIDALTRIKALKTEFPGIDGVKHSPEFIATATTLEQYRTSKIGWYFSKKYSAACSRCDALLGQPQVRRFEARVSWLKAVTEYTLKAREYEQHSAAASIVLGSQWKEMDTDDVAGKAALDAGVQLRSTLLPMQCGRTILASLSRARPATTATSWTQDLQQAQTALKRFDLTIDGITRSLALTESATKAMGQTISLFEIAKHLSTMAGAAERLPEMVQLNIALAEISSFGFPALSDAVRAFEGRATEVATGVKATWLSTIARTALQGSPETLEMLTRSLRTLEQEFAAADSERLRATAQHVARQHWEAIPRIVTGGQFGELEREFRKNGGYRSLADLSGVALQALKTIKPIIMATPDGCAAHLPKLPRAYSLWMTDEASQQLLSEGLGALARVERLVVVGDSKQMPPSRTFKVGGNEGQASLLEEAQSKGAASYMFTCLRRFHRPELIHTSNRWLYGGRLSCPPSPLVGSADTGVKFTLHNHPRDGEGTNAGEASLVVDRMIEVAQNSPNLSLAVVTISEEQSFLIRKTLEQRVGALKDTALTTYFDPDRPNAVITSSLEKIQGRECDVLLISPGYAPDTNGRIRNQFSPLIMQEDGAKALNVGSTRGARRCEWITALDPDKMDTSKVTSPGVHAFKEYLSDAKKLAGMSDAPATFERPISAIQADIAKFLESSGFPVTHNVGDRNYYVNIAVADPASPRVLRVAIRLDDEQFHGAPTARDRHRLYQSTLEQRDWRVFSVTSVEWALNNPAMKKELLEFVGQVCSSAPQPLQRVNATSGVVRSPGSCPIQRATGTPYLLADITSIAPKSVDKLTPSICTKLVQRIVEAEAPVHRSEIVRRVRDALTLKKMPDDAAQAVDDAVSRLRAPFRIKDGFVYHSDIDLKPRSRRDFHPSHKDLEKIAPEEIDAALLFVVRQAGGIEHADLLEETSRILGWVDGVPKGGEDLLLPRIERLVNTTGEIVEEGSTLIAG